MKKNCWEATGCGREPDGSKVDEQGVCPAAIEAVHDGKNGGRNAGRFCWMVAGTMCDGEFQGLFCSKTFKCVRCDFFQQVHREEGPDLIKT